MDGFMDGALMVLLTFYIDAFCQKLQGNKCGEGILVESWILSVGSNLRCVECHGQNAEIPTIPIASMYVISTYIYHKNQPNLGLNMPWFPTQIARSPWIFSG